MSVLPIDPSSVLTGGLSGDATSGAGGGQLEILFNSPFNVGSGELSSSASSTPSSGIGGAVGDLLPVLIIGGVVWLTATLVK